MKFHYNFFVLVVSSLAYVFSRMLCVLLDCEISELMIFFKWIWVVKLNFLQWVPMLLLPIAILSSGSFLVLQCVLAFATNMFITRLLFENQALTVFCTEFNVLFMSSKFVPAKYN